MITLHYTGDDALALVVAADSAEAVLNLTFERGVISEGERDHALIQFRKLRADLLKARGDALQQILNRRKPVDGKATDRRGNED